MATLIPQRLLEQKQKILFISHLAIGDFSYMQNGLAAFAEKYPHLEIHFWVEEVRKTSDESKWASLAKYSLYDWLEALPFITKVYKETYSPQHYQVSLSTAKNEHYPIIVSLGTLPRYDFAGLALSIADKNSFVVGVDVPKSFFQYRHKKNIQKLSARLNHKPPCIDATHHVSDESAHWFASLGEIELTKTARYPFINIPDDFVSNAQTQVAKWHKRMGKVVFINVFAKNKKRCWPLENAVALIQKMKASEQWKESLFIINSMPSDVERSQKVIEHYQLDNVQLFSATENFFELPAMLSVSDLIISVETAVMHLANAVKVPVIALMRQKTPHWVPIDKENSTVIFTPRRQDHVNAISVDAVIKALP